jgi:TetR/AcrR family transcriptional regulator, fatty acid metabolism regulator protein
MSVYIMKTGKRRVLMAPEVRRRQLLESATWVFARKGYRRAAIDDIIARAGVARGTFYLHFDSKEQVFLAVVDDFHDCLKRAFEALDEAATRARGEGPRAVLQASFRRWFEFFAEHRDAARIVWREAAAIDPRFEERLLSLRGSALTRFSARFRRLQDVGLARSTVDPDLFAHFQLGMLDELLNWSTLNDDRADVDALARQLADFEWNGIRPR